MYFYFYIFFLQTFSNCVIESKKGIQSQVFYKRIIMKRDCLRVMISGLIISLILTTIITASSLPLKERNGFTSERSNGLSPPLESGYDFSSATGNGFESPDYRVLLYQIHDIDENYFCLTKDLIADHVELRLLQHGITPQTEKIDAGFPHLEVSINLSENAFSMHLYLSRISSYSVGHNRYQKRTIVWSEEIINQHEYDPELIFDALDDLLSRFLAPYLSVNHSLSQ